MSPFVQLRRSCQTRRPGADNSNSLSRPNLWRIRFNQMMFPCIFNDSIFIFLNSNRLVIQSAGTCFFTKCRADTGGKFRKIIGQQQTLCCPVKHAVIYQVIPFRTQVVQRTAGHHAAQQRFTGLTERNATVHAACALPLPFL